MSDDIDSTEPSEALCVTLTRLRDALSKVSGTWAIKAQLDKCIRALQVEGYTTALARRVRAVVSHAQFTLQEVRADPALTETELAAVDEAADTYEICLRLLA